MVFFTFYAKTEDPVPSFKFHPRVLGNLIKVCFPRCHGATLSCHGRLAGRSHLLSPLPVAPVAAPLSSRPSPQYIFTGKGLLQCNLLQGTAFYHSELPPHSTDSAPLAADTQFHFAPTTLNPKAWEHVCARGVVRSSCGARDHVGERAAQVGGGSDGVSRAPSLSCLCVCCGGGPPC